MGRRRAPAVLAALAAAATLTGAAPAAGTDPSPTDPAPTASSPTAAPSAPSADRRPVPEGFRAQSTSWITSRHGWVLGTATCDGAPCTSVIATRDGGDRWSARGRIDAPLAPPGEPGVTNLVMADPLQGWAFGPSLHATDDGGRTWHAAEIPDDGAQVLALAADRGVVHAVTTTCAIGDPAACEAAPTLWTARPGGPWRQVGLDLPAGSLAATLAVHHSTAYLVVPQPPPTPDAFHVTTDRGRTWAPAPVPCAARADEVLADVAPTSRTDVALLCVGGAGFGQASKRVLVSDDNAATTTPAGMTSDWGIRSDLAATPDGTLAVASVSSGSWMYRSDGDGTWTTPVARGDGGAGWNDLTFTTNTDGVVVYAPARWADGEGTLLATHDAGRTWTPVPVGPAE